MQLKCKLTTTHYKAVTVFVDVHSSLQYRYLMTVLTSQETTGAKDAFMPLAVDNEIKSGNIMLILDVLPIIHSNKIVSTQMHDFIIWHQDPFQSITERVIRNITESARTMLLYANA